MTLNELSLSEAVAAIHAGEVSATEVALDCLDRIGERDSDVAAWHWMDDRERILARVGEAHGDPLCGLLFGVKDTIDTADMPTEYGSRLFAGHQPAADAAPVTAIKRSGGVVVGKTVATEFAYFTPGRTMNPHDRERSPGGSSSGSAAAVADHMVPFALGGQTAGSVIRPASYCGCIGYVGSHEELPLSGVKPLAPSFDALGVFARTVDDVRLVRDALLLRPTSAWERNSHTKPLRIALTSGTATGEVDDDMAELLLRVAGQLQAAGARIEPLGLETVQAELGALHQRIMAYEAARALALDPDSLAHVGSELRELVETGWGVTFAEYREAKQRVERGEERFEHAAKAADVILAPAAPGAAPAVESTGSPHLCRPWQALGRPSIALPAGFNADGLPLGVQLIGWKGRDDEMLDAAEWVEEQLRADRPAHELNLSTAPVFPPQRDEL